MIIGIAGYKGSGKDTAGSVLTDVFNFEKMSFAAPIKNLVASTFEQEYVRWYNTGVKRFKRTNVTTCI